MGLTLNETKEFILFCADNKVLQAKFGELEFTITPVLPAMPEQPKMPTDEELLYGSVGG